MGIVEANVDCRTTDGYIVRMFCIAFTKPQENQIKNTCYAKSAQSRAIRLKMTQIMSDLGTKGDLKSLVKELISAPIGEQSARRRPFSLLRTATSERSRSLRSQNST